MGIEFLPALFPIPGLLVFAAYVLCIAMDMARRFSIPAFVGSLVVSGALASSSTAPPDASVGWYFVAQFLSFFTLVGLAFAGLAHLARATSAES